MGRGDINVVQGNVGNRSKSQFVQKFACHDVTFGFYSSRMRTTGAVKRGNDRISNIFKRPLGFLGGKWEQRVKVEVEHQLGGNPGAQVREDMGSEQAGDR